MAICLDFHRAPCGINQKNLQSKKIKENWGSNTVKERSGEQEE
jgi:aryl-phospho-beta-D-glucosidase BglC (GH1 family)